MISRAEFVYNACVDALDTFGFPGASSVYAVYQDDPDQTTSVVYVLSREDWYQALDGYDNTDTYEISIKSVDYVMLRKIDRKILDNLHRDNRLLGIESGSDIVEDSTSRQNTFWRNRRVIIN